MFSIFEQEIPNVALLVKITNWLQTVVLLAARGVHQLLNYLFFLAIVEENLVLALHAQDKEVFLNLLNARDAFMLKMLIFLCHLVIIDLYKE
jgi:hypothetical protein